MRIIFWISQSNRWITPEWGNALFAEARSSINLSIHIFVWVSIPPHRLSFSHVLRLLLSLYGRSVCRSLAQSFCVFMTHVSIDVELNWMENGEKTQKINNRYIHVIWRWRKTYRMSECVWECFLLHRIQRTQFTVCRVINNKGEMRWSRWSKMLISDEKWIPNQSIECSLILIY